MQRLLLVDNDPVARLVVEFFVRGTDVSLVMADDPDEAMARLAEAVAAGAPFDAVVADPEAGGASGAALLDWAREASPRTARLALTGRPEAQAEALARGRADWLLRKPLDPLEVRRALGEVLPGRW